MHYPDGSRIQWALHAGFVHVVSCCEYINRIKLFSVNSVTRDRFSEYQL